MDLTILKSEKVTESVRDRFSKKDVYGTTHGNNLKKCIQIGALSIILFSVKILYNYMEGQTMKDKKVEIKLPKGKFGAMHYCGECYHLDSSDVSKDGTAAYCKLHRTYA